MRFQISKVQADGYWVPLTDSRVSDGLDNIFTLVVGQNAVGKSRLLRKIVSNYIFSYKSRTKSSTKVAHSYEQLIPYASTVWDESSRLSGGERNLNYTANKVESYASRLSYERGHYADEVEVALGSSIFPSNVVAVSTGRYDRFPSPTHARNKEIVADYRYIGTEQFSKSSISSSLISLLEGLSQGEQSLHRLSDIFEYLGFAPYLDIKLSFDRRHYSKLTVKEIDELRYTSSQNLFDFLMADDAHIYGGYSNVDAFYEYLKAQSKANMEIYFRDDFFGGKNNVISELIPFFKSGIVKIADITLIKITNKSRMRLSQASSGQQCMLTIMLGIAGAIRDGSLICIDEPEISLHPQWQSSLVKQLQEVFSNFYGCHFVIATHSPQLVSGLTHTNGYVLNLEEKELYHSLDYAKRSADFQLAEVFHTPGQNNEYLLRITLLLLTKLTRREKLNFEDIESLKKLSSIRRNMSDTDPVFHLIGQVEALY